MTDAQIRACELMLSSQVTNHPVDQARAVLMIRATNGNPEVVAMIRRNRRAWLNWLTLTQRQWQAKPRTITERDIAYRTAIWGGHHDYGTVAASLVESVETRERYVRCG